MKCKKCNKEIPESVGECVHCTEGIMEVYQKKMDEDEDEA